MRSSRIKLPERIHVVGICGVATSALAIAFHKKGVTVTGSDKGFFPPISTELEKHGVSFYAGWHPEKMTAGGAPQLVIVGTASGSQNTETATAEQLGIPMCSFAEAIGKFFTREISIVCAGTWGKTSSSAMLSAILEHAGLDPTYMFGGVSLSHDSSARLSDSGYSVLEGDEYKSSPTDPRPKFSYYKPTHLLLTAVSWDHADLYPTEESYMDAFGKLIASIPEKGLIVANKDHSGVTKLLKDSSNKVRTVSYGKTGADYTYKSVKQSENGLDFVIENKGVPENKGATYEIHSPMIGSFQAENITGCFAMAREIGIEPNKIIEAVADFKGLKRRLEKRLVGKDSPSGVSVFDDIAHSPEKAGSVLKNIREIYKGKIIAVFEPNIGGRAREAIAKYDSAFKAADIVVIPRLTKLKIADGDKKAPSAQLPMEGEELTTIIGKTHSNARYIEDDEELVSFLRSNATKGDVIVFLGSHGFRGMIEDVIMELNSQRNK